MKSLITLGVVLLVSAPALAGVKQDIAALKTEIVALKAENVRIQQKLANLKDDGADLANGIMLNSDTIQKNIDSISKNRASILAQVKAIANNRKDISTISKTLNDNHNRLVAVGKNLNDNNKRLKDISVRDPDDPNQYNLRILANMDRSRVFRNEVYHASKTRLMIYNSSGRARSLYVNGIEWRVPRGKWSSVPITRGPVTVGHSFRSAEQITLPGIGFHHDDRGFYCLYHLVDHREMSGPEDTGSRRRNRFFDGAL